MKIVIDARMINMSGIGRYLRSILDPLLERLNGDFVLLGYQGELEEYRDKNNVTLFEMSTRIYNPLEHWELKRKIPPCDIYFSPHFLTPFFNIPARKRITTIHDLFHLSDIAEFSYIKRSYLKWLFRNAAIKSDHIITVSRFTEKTLNSLFPETNRKTVVIHNSIDRGLFKKTDGERPIQEKYALFVGNIKPHKNINRLINVLAQAKDLELKLIIVGDRNNFMNGIPGFEKLVDSMSSVFFTGRISDVQLVSYYSHADFLIFPSLYEGFGYPPLEAMSCGTPVAASSLDVVREVCGDAVLYFNPTDENDMIDKISHFARDENMRKEYASRGEIAVSMYDSEISIEKHITLFRSL